jgi:aquaporin Z
VDSPPLVQRLLAEVFGTFLFFFLGFSAIAAFVNGGGEEGTGILLTIVAIPAGFGFGLALAIAAFGHISGGHFNPAVTLGLTIGRKFPARDIVPYWVAQLVGGFGAVLVQAIVFDSAVTDALSTNPGFDVTDWGALVLEIVATGLFVMVILTVAADSRAAWYGVMAPLMIGLYIFTAANAIGTTSGGSLNPARSIDPALWNQDWDNIWIYIVGPLAGAVIGAAIWAGVVDRDGDSDAEAELVVEERFEIVDEPTDSG